ncbi:MAG TPA: class I adenylate-forming enzyme family protein [Terriglobales bacterium]
MAVSTTPTTSPEGAPNITASEFSATPLLDAFENFKGTFHDLDAHIKVSAGELKNLKNEAQRKMTAGGITPGDIVVAALPNGSLFAAVWAASLASGASPILVHSETPAAELERMADRWGAHFMVSGGADTGEILLDEPYGTLRWRRRENNDADSPPSRFVSVPLHPTSGTTSEPKIAVRPGPCAVAEPRHYIQALGVDKSDIILCAIPMSHAYAYGMCLMVSLLTSADLLYMRKFHPGLLRTAINEMGVSVFPAIPVMLDSLLPQSGKPMADHPRIVLSAGATLGKRTFLEFRKAYGIDVRPLYGTTETGGISIGDGDDAANGAVGCAMQGVEVELQRSDRTKLDDKTGILRVRSSSMMAGYLEGNTMGLDAVDDGCFETGDLAQIDVYGKIHLLGRISEVINAFGFKVIPREVEEVIAMLPEVVEVKVYPRRRGDADTVEAAVVCQNRFSERQILAHCEKHLVDYKCPTAIHLVDSLPRTESGKVAIDRLPK